MNLKFLLVGSQRQPNSLRNESIPPPTGHPSSLDLALHDLVHDLLLEVRHLLRRHRVGLGEHRDDVDLINDVINNLII